MVRSNSRKKIVDSIPLDRILIESDAPFTSTLKYKYDLFFVKEVYEYLAKSRDMQLEEIYKIVKCNFKNVFS